MGAEVIRAIEQFLYRVARLLDERQFHRYSALKPSHGCASFPLEAFLKRASVDILTIHPVLCGHKIQAIDVCMLCSLYLQLTYHHVN
jgi:hypothetical protein